MVGAHVPVPVRKVRGSRRDGRSTFVSLLAGMVAVGGKPYPGEVSEGTGRERLCACVKRSTLNSAIEQELRDRRVEDMANATSYAQHGLLLCESLHSKSSDRIKKHMLDDC